MPACANREYGGAAIPAKFEEPEAESLSDDYQRVTLIPKKTGEHKPNEVIYDLIFDPPLTNTRTIDIELRRSRLRQLNLSLLQ